MPRPSVSSAVKFINERGILLVFPIDNRSEPESLWSSYFPKTKMNWDWTDDGDGRVAELWHLRAELSTCNEVVYTKWYRGRATFFSREMFVAVLSLVSKLDLDQYGIGVEARSILEVLDGDSPLPTKRLRNFTELEGKQFETAFNRGMRELWSRLLIVGYGEVEEGGFPSLAVGATRLLFEDLWDESLVASHGERADRIVEKLETTSAFGKFYQKFQKGFTVRNRTRTA